MMISYSNKIAITGVGGGVGQSIMKSLCETNYDIVALDGEILATGLYASPISYLIPYANNSDYIPSLLNICEKEKVALLFPGLDAELSPLSSNRDAFNAVGTTVIVSPPFVIELSNNKQKMYDILKSHGFYVPYTIPLNEINNWDVTYPIIIKQNIGGARSKNVFLIKNSDQWKAVIKNIEPNFDNYIVQEYIEGEEYTCGSINLDNNCKGVIVMRRILRDGDTYKCFTENNMVIEDAVRRLVEAIKPFGACNIQLRMKENKPYVFEINARCSGTTAARTLCGFNEPKMIADFLLKGINPTFEIKKMTILRYWNELIVNNEKITHMIEHQFHTNNNGSRL